MTPSAPERTSIRTWAGRLTPKPTATGTGESAFAEATRPRTEGGSEARAPVTPTSETQYRNPPERRATSARRTGVVVGAIR